MKIEKRRSTTSGKVLYKVTKPGFQHDMFLTEDQMRQFITEAARLGVFNHDGR